MHNFSHWVYSWFEETKYPFSIYHNGRPKYTDADVLEQIKDWIEYYEEEEEKNVNYTFLRKS